MDHDRTGDPPEEDSTEELQDRRDALVEPHEMDDDVREAEEEAKGKIRAPES